jgi:hypothetical protein
MGKFIRSSAFGWRVERKSAAQDEQHSQVPGTFLERIVQDMNENLEGHVAELVFNLDAVGISDSEDRETKRIVVPAAMFDQMIHHGGSRNVKHI